MLSHFTPSPSGGGLGRGGFDKSNGLILYPLSLALSRRERGRFICIMVIQFQAQPDETICINIFIRTFITFTHCCPVNFTSSCRTCSGIQEVIETTGFRVKPGMTRTGIHYHVSNRRNQAVRHVCQPIIPMQGFVNGTAVTFTFELSGTAMDNYALFSKQSQGM